jgi:hypothetical protein
MDERMSWFDFFTSNTGYRHQFGRGINANIAPNEEELFEKSYEAFEEKRILDAYEYFLKSLENFTDKTPNENIVLNRVDDKLEFIIYQGTSKISGYTTQEHLYAEVNITKKQNASVALKRRILERNYQLTYAKYFMDDEFIKIKLFHDNITMSPQKVFFPLRELALNSDFDKEYIKSEFLDITLEDTQHLEQLDANEIKLKYDFMMKWIENLETRVQTLPSNDNAGMQSFIYLTLLFQIDYLIVPHYDIYQKITKKVQDFFSQENNSSEAKNEELREYVQSLKEMKLDEFSQNFYNAKYTFNPMEKTSSEDVNLFISESLVKIRWYKNNRYKQIIPTLYKYIAFYIQYNYGVNPVIKSLLHTLIEIQNQEFFNALEYQSLYDAKTNSFSKRAISSKIESAIAPYQSKFKSLEPFGQSLNYSSLNEFSHSFYLQIQNLNFEEI